MPLTIEAATWDEAQLREEIAIRLPSIWAFSLDPDEEINRYVVTIINDKNEVIWSGTNITSQLVLLDALGWLETQRSRVSESSPWFRRRTEELNSQRVHEHLFGKTLVADEVPDLDPKEVDAVYSNRPKRPL